MLKEGGDQFSSPSVGTRGLLQSSTIKGDNLSKEEGQASLIGITEEGKDGDYIISIQIVVSTQM